MHRDIPHGTRDGYKRCGCGDCREANAAHNRQIRNAAAGTTDHLTKKDRVKLAGNAVTPPNTAWIVGRTNERTR